MPQTPYKHPPVIEALCEIHFEPGPEWDATLLGLYYEKIKDAFPEKRELRNVQVSIQAAEAELSHFVRETGVRMQFVRADKTAMVQVAPNMLVVNQLPPYPHWGEFNDLITARVGDYVAVAAPKGMQRVGLRYINRFSFAPAEFDFQALFGRSALIPPALFEAAKPFLFRLELDQAPGERLLLTMATPPAELETATVILDLDHVSSIGGEASAEGLMAQLNRAHDRIEAVFESCLTDRLRQQLNTS